MAIDVTCPNGHSLRVKEKFAGKSGLCPVCSARVQVPQSEDDKIVEWLGGAAAAARGTSEPTVTLPLAASETSSDSASVHDEDPPEGSGVSLMRSGIIRHQKLCGSCSRQIPMWYATCPHCGEHFQV